MEEVSIHRLYLYEHYSVGFRIIQVIVHNKVLHIQAGMWSEPDFSYPEMESAYRPLLAWQRRPPRFPIPYARPPDMPPPFMKPDINMVRMGIPPPFRMPRIPLELVTPHAGWFFYDRVELIK